MMWEGLIENRIWLTITSEGGLLGQIPTDSILYLLDRPKPLPNSEKHQLVSIYIKGAAVPLVVRGTSAEIVEFICNSKST
jgi:hypothetical protein